MPRIENSQFYNLISGSGEAKLKTSNYDEEKFLCQQLPLAGITHKGVEYFYYVEQIQL